MHAVGPNESTLADHEARPEQLTAADGSIVVNAPIAEVYQRWLQVEDYPKFITIIKRVRKLDENHFFVSLAFDGDTYDVTLEIMLRVPERRLAWRTVSLTNASDHLGAGVVSFAEGANHSTHVTLKVTSTFGRPLSERVDNYLQQFKVLMETGRCAVGAG